MKIEEGVMLMKNGKAWGKDKEIIIPFIGHTGFTKGQMIATGGSVFEVLEDSAFNEVKVKHIRDLTPFEKMALS